MPKPIRQPSKLAEALKLDNRGLWVVPCASKVPIWKNWHKKKRSRKTLETALRQDPSLNIAIVLNQSDYIDVECDKPEAEQALQDLFGGTIPDTPTWQSSRGPHRLFRRPKDIPEKAVIEIDDVEFHIGNGKGAAAVVPPSIHLKTGKHYRWLSNLSIYDVEPAELPESIVERLIASGVAPADNPSDGETVGEGKRNNTLFSKACSLRQVGLPKETIVSALLDLNKRLCKPPLSESEVRSIAESATSGDSVKIGFVARLLGDVELWHDDNDDPYITLTQAEHRENWKIDRRSRPFCRWLSKLWYDTTGDMLGSSDLGDIAAMLEGKACFDGPRYKVFRRVAECNEKFYLDLCDGEWRAVEIDVEGWRVVSDLPVKFRRAKAMLPLPLPVATPGTELGNLMLPFLNIRVEQWPLVATWLVAALRPIGPYPIEKLLGEQGSAKTTSARVQRSVVDPNAAPVRAEPRNTHDLVIAAGNGWVICLDNLSSMKANLSDALCRLSTGGGFATRTLYTDEDETLFDAMRPVILTSIEEIGCRSDLLERSLIIELPTIREADRKAEKTFWAEFEAVRPRTLGALLDVISGALRRLPEVEQRTDVSLPRLADFFVWGCAAEESLGFAPGTFAEAFRANQETATQTVLTSSPVLAALLEYLRKNAHIEDTAAGLLKKLGWANIELKAQPGWPKTPRVLSAILRRAAPNLRQVGITAEQDTRGGGNMKEKIWRIRAPEGFGAKTKKSAKKKSVRKTIAKKSTKKSDAKNHPTKKRRAGSKGRKGSKLQKSIPQEGKR